MCFIEDFIQRDICRDEEKGVGFLFVQQLLIELYIRKLSEEFLNTVGDGLREEIPTWKKNP